MDIQSMLRSAAESFSANAGPSASGLDLSSVIQALTGLLDGADGEIDLASIVSRMDAQGLMSMAASWLGNGQNAGIDPQQILALFGSDKIAGFAQSLGLPETDAVSGLQAALPDLIDKASQDGALTTQNIGAQLLSSGLKGLFG